MPRMSATEPSVRTRWSERALAVATHLSFPIGFTWATVNGHLNLLSPWMLLVPLIGACLVASWSRRAMPFARDHARESINLQVSVLLASIAFAFLLLTSPGAITLAIALFAAYVLTSFAQACEAAWSAGMGREFRPPLAFRFLR